MRIINLIKNKKLKMKSMKRLYALIISAVVLFSCDKDDNDQPSSQLLKGAEVAVGSGKANSFIQLDNYGNPISAGFTFTEAVLSGLPDEETSFILPMPADNKTLFNHISF